MTIVIIKHFVVFLCLWFNYDYKSNVSINGLPGVGFMYVCAT